MNISPISFNQALDEQKENDKIVSDPSKDPVVVKQMNRMESFFESLERSQVREDSRKRSNSI